MMGKILKMLSREKATVGDAVEIGIHLIAGAHMLDDDQFDALYASVSEILHGDDGTQSFGFAS